MGSGRSRDVVGSVGCPQELCLRSAAESADLLDCVERMAHGKYLARKEGAEVPQNGTAANWKETAAGARTRKEARSEELPAI